MLALLLALSTAAAGAEQAGRVVLETTVGDLVLALRADAAPKQSERFLRLVRRGFYDDATVDRIDPTLYVRIGPARRRGAPLTSDQARELAKPRPAVERGLPHDFGVVTVAHAVGEKDETGTSLAFMLARVPSMDGRFASFAEVERGQKVLEYLRDEPCGPDHAPLAPIRIKRAYVADAVVVSLLGLREPPERRRFDLLPAAVAALAGLALFAFSSSRAGRSLGLLAVLSGFFMGLVAVGGEARQSPWLGTLLLAAAVAVFRLMSNFESERPVPH